MNTDVRLDNRAPAKDGDLVVIDQVEVGVHLAYSGAGPHPVDHMYASLQARGVLITRRRDRDKGRLALTLPVVDDDGVVLGEASAELYVEHQEAGTLTVRSRSAVRFNLQLPLRRHLGLSDQFVGFDRKHNFVGPTADLGDDALAFQIEFACHGIEQLGELIAASVPHGAARRRGEMWLRKAEVCHDLACGDPIMVSRAASHAAMAGTRIGNHDCYRAGKGTGPVPVAHWRSKARGEIIKIYPKTNDLLRIEVSCHPRDSVASCCGNRRMVGFDAAGMEDLLIEFYEQAGHTCCAALDHVRAMVGSTKSPADLHHALQPLFAVSRRERAGSGYTPNAAAAAAADRFYNALISDGIVSAIGHRKGTKVRDILESLTGPHGPLCRGGANGIYCLKPEYGRAASQHSSPSNADSSEREEDEK